MKTYTNHFVALVVIVLVGCAKFDYPENPGDIPAGAVPALACDEKVTKEFDLPINANSKFYIYDVTNTGTCKANVKVEIGGAELSSQPVDTAKHLVFIDEIPKGNAGQNLHFILNCENSEMGTCTMDFNVRICDKVKNPQNPTFSVRSASTGAIAGDPAIANQCKTPASNKTELLEVKNESRQDHSISFEIVSTCNCPEFHVEPVGANVGPRQKVTVDRFKVKKNSSFKLTAFCDGNPVNDPSCSGRIANITVTPR